LRVVGAFVGALGLALIAIGALRRP
jgi:hypothetical protein